MLEETKWKVKYETPARNKCICRRFLYRASSHKLFNKCNKDVKEVDGEKYIK